MLRNIERFDPETIDWIEETIRTRPEVSRTGLARLVCERLDWRAPNGRHQVTSCYVALRRLEELGVIRLPAPRTPWLNDPEHRRRLPPYDRSALECSLADLGRIRLLMVNGDRERMDTWRRMMDTFHPLGAGRLCGAQIRYIIEAEHGGVLGGLAFTSAALRLRARDQWIGWDDATRDERLGMVVNNSRFLILPQVRVAHLASKVLGLAARTVRRDWERLYARAPVLLETFVDPRCYRGTCYRAANWTRIGATTGRGRCDQEDLEAPKDIYVLPLRRDFRKVLGGRPPKPPEDWAEEEFGGVDLGDKRLGKRLLHLARAFAAKPEADLPAACGSKAALKAAYRFFRHPAVNMATLLAGHYQATEQRVRAHKGVILAVQDTTTLNYHTHDATNDLGPIDAHGTQGLLVHDTMAFTAEGVPLGLIDVQVWARDPADSDKKAKEKIPESDKWLKSFDAAARLSQSCSNRLVVSVGDREADFYDLFVKATPGNQGPQILVRAHHNRRLDDKTGQIWEHMDRRPVAGIKEVQIPARAGRSRRKARLEIRFDRVTLQPPPEKKDMGPVTLWAVLVTENPKPNKGKPLEWLLLTTVPVENFDDACERVDWYGRRWGIEVFHRIIKSGCRIESRRLQHAERLSSCLAIDMVIGWRVYFLTKQGRETPNAPCTVLLEEDEWKALVTYVTKTPVAPDHPPPSLGEAMVMIAQLGGYMPQKNTHPGPQTTWRGMAALSWITESWRAFKNAHAPP